MWFHLPAGKWSRGYRRFSETCVSSTLVQEWAKSSSNTLLHERNQRQVCSSSPARHPFLIVFLSISLFFFLSLSVIYPLSPLRSVTKQVDGAAGGGVHVCVAGEFEPVPELPTFTTRESDQPTVPHLPKYQVHRYHIHNITLLNFEKHCYWIFLNVTTAKC